MPWLPLHHLPVPFLCACCQSPGRWEEMAPSCELEGAVLWLGPLHGGFVGSCFQVWSVRTPCFKGSGCELASEAFPQLTKNFLLFLNHQFSLHFGIN